MRCWPLVGVVLLVAAAWAIEPEPDSTPEPGIEIEIAWIIENSMVGNLERERFRLLLEDFGTEAASPPLDLPGVDLEWGRRLLVGEIQPDAVAPASLVGISSSIRASLATE